VFILCFVIFHYFPFLFLMLPLMMILYDDDDDDDITFVSNMIRGMV